MVIHTEEYFRGAEITAQNIHKFIVIPNRDDLDAPPAFVSLDRFSSLVSSKEQEDSNLSSCKLPFVWKLYEMLDDVEQQGNEHIVSWVDNGTAFRVHKLKEFVKDIIPSYFKQSKYKSFQRQLNFYQFSRITTGPNTGAYKHSKFVKGQKSLCLSMTPKTSKNKNRRTTAMPVLSRQEGGQQVQNPPSTAVPLPPTTQLQRGPSVVVSATTVSSPPPVYYPSSSSSGPEESRTPIMTKPPTRRVSANENEIVSSNKTSQQQQEEAIQQMASNQKKKEESHILPDNGDLMDIFGMRFHFVDTSRTNF